MDNFVILCLTIIDLKKKRKTYNCRKTCPNGSIRGKTWKRNFMVKCKAYEVVYVCVCALVRMCVRGQKPTDSEEVTNEALRTMCDNTLQLLTTTVGRLADVCIYMSIHLSVSVDLVVYDSTHFSHQHEGISAFSKSRNIKIKMPRSKLYLGLKKTNLHQSTNVMEIALRAKICMQCQQSAISYL